MASPGCNEADARAKLIDPAPHRARWVERVTEAERHAHGEIRREPCAVRTGKAQAIEDAMYGLKAVNPAEKKGSDTRTPAELLQAIADKGMEVDEALDRLKGIDEVSGHEPHVHCLVPVWR
jgi:hypothetical protein